MPHDAHPMGVLVSAMSALSVFHPDANPALRVSLIFWVWGIVSYVLLWVVIGILQLPCIVAHCVSVLCWLMFLLKRKLVKVLPHPISPPKSRNSANLSEGFILLAGKGKKKWFPWVYVHWCLVKDVDSIYFYPCQKYFASISSYSYNGLLCCGKDQTIFPDFSCKLNCYG